MSSSALSRACSSGKITRVLPRTYLVAGVPWDWLTRVRAAGAWSHGAVSHLTAAILHGLVDRQTGTIEVSCPTRKTSPVPAIKIHVPRMLTTADVVDLKGILVTTPARTLLDIASQVSPADLEAHLEELLRRGLVSIPRMRWQLQREGHSGRNGVAELRRLLDVRGQNVATESPLETAFSRWFRDARLPSPVRQHRVMDGPRFIARIDFAYPVQRVGIEVTSYRWHSGRRDWVRDLERDRALKALGWRLVYAVHEDLLERPRDLEAEIAGLLGLTLF